MTVISIKVAGNRGKSKEKWRESSWNYQCQVNAVTMIPRTMISQDETGRVAREGWAVTSLGRPVPGRKGIKLAFVILLASVRIALRDENF